jgi:hypothetical protein
MSTLLIIGNGFDLHCGLQSSYSNFFDSESRTSDFSIFKNDFAEDRSHFRSGAYPLITEICSFSSSESVWRVFFWCLGLLRGSQSQFQRWCDVENEIRQSLLPKSPLVSSFWQEVYSLVSSNWETHRSLSLGTEENFLYQWMASYIVNNKKACFKNHPDAENFYAFLLEELAAFEKHFGFYLRDEVISHPDYRENAASFVQQLCGNDSVIIESFNFTAPSIKNVKIRNLHGSLTSPIFGIDVDQIDTDGPLYRFTKDIRCLKNQAGQEEVSNFDVITQVVVYGHALDPQDYNYFFSMLSTMELQGANRQVRLKFLYSPHGDVTEEEARTQTSEAVAKLINHWDKANGKPISTLSRLYFQKQIVIRKA